MIPARGLGKFFQWMVFALAWAFTLSSEAAQTTPNARDTLVYKDGDRVQGAVVSQTAEEIVFKSDRFGEVRVRATDAVVIKAEKGATPKDRATQEAIAAAAPPTPVPKPPPDATPAEKKAAAAAAEKAEEERVTIWDRFSPAVLTARVRNYFGPWHGRLSFATEVVSDVAERNNSSYEAHLSRKWKTDEAQLNARFDYSKTDDVVTTDMLKLWGQWRHEFNKQIFAHYRPTGEWNRASRLRGRPNDYVLLQQELGFGWHVLTKPSRKLRVGLSQNLFDTWNLTPPNRSHTSHGVVSSFEEIELTLPWRITISQRGVWYPVRNDQDGWENRFEINKKLTETLSTSLRHEIRRHNPDGTAQDYDRLKLLFGLDF
jgi:hypothetical protein